MGLGVALEQSHEVTYRPTLDNCEQDHSLTLVDGPAPHENCFLSSLD